jgi:ribokinase
VNDTTAPARIIVVGSANQDYLVRVSSPPGPGETVLAESLIRQPGGKGANQAVAAARLRGNVSFVGCVGDDPDGAFLLRGLRSEGVDTTNVEIVNRGRTGLAFVSVYDSGENSITVVPGTNFALSADRVQFTVSRLAREAGSAIVVIQAELLPEIIATALRTAHAEGARCVFNLAPYQPLDADLLALCDPLVVNEAEAGALVGWPVNDPESAARAVKQLRDVARSVVVTIGPQGAYWADQADEGHVPTRIGATVVDTTGAGDAFVGALAASLARGADLKTATTLGVAAGTFAVGMPGAQSSYPTLADLESTTDAGDSTARLLRG